VDIREWRNSANYRWRPRNRFLVSFGPDLNQLVNWNRRGQLQDWSVQPVFSLEVRRLTTLEISRTESYELFRNTGFRKNRTDLEFNTEWYRWLALTADYNWGKGVNYYPGNGLAPFLARSRNASVGLKFRPRPRLRLDESYIYSRLGATREWLPDTAPAPGAIFNNHILRTKANYQFSRELSLRAIFDYNGVLPNDSLVSLEKSKRVGADLLLTYLLHPGTALYIGYTNVRENLAWDPMLSPALQRTGFPDTNTGRQVFIKLSYQFRY
jgi:hypothetical protein